MILLLSPAGETLNDNPFWIVNDDRGYWTSDRSTLPEVTVNACVPELPDVNR